MQKKQAYKAIKEKEIQRTSNIAAIRTQSVEMG